MSSVANKLPRVHVKSDHVSIVLNVIKYVIGILGIALVIVISFKVLQVQAPQNMVIDPKHLNYSEYQVLRQDLIDSTYDQSDFNFFYQPLADVIEQIHAYDWVAEAVVQRDWRLGVTVTVLPKTPIARFGSDHFIDANGDVFRPIGDVSTLASDLTMLQGEMSQSKHIMQQMQQINAWFAPLDLQVVDLVLTPRRTWLIKFDNGLRVTVDNKQTGQKLMHLSHVLQTQLQDALPQMAAIDLRYQNGFAITWKVPTQNANAVIDQVIP